MVRCGTWWRSGCRGPWRTAERWAGGRTPSHWWRLDCSSAAAARRTDLAAACGRWDVVVRSGRARRRPATAAARPARPRPTPRPWQSRGTAPSWPTSSARASSRKLWRRRATARRQAEWLLTRHRSLERSGTDRDRECPAPTRITTTVHTSSFAYLCHTFCVFSLLLSHLFIINVQFDLLLLRISALIIVGNYICPAPKETERILNERIKNLKWEN